LFDREKLAYDLALQYAGAKCPELASKTGDTDAICKNLLEDFALAYKTMSEFSNEEFRIFLREDE
jgi:hypothetical protein